jgi:hypothetical protein
MILFFLCKHGKAFQSDFPCVELRPYILGSTDFTFSSKGKRREGDVVLFSTMGFFTSALKSCRTSIPYSTHECTYTMPVTWYNH